VALALIAGGTPLAATLLGGAMLGFQSSIGATNDLADQVVDAARDARKPIPAGQVSVGAARVVAVAGAAVGLAIAALVSPAALQRGAAGLTCGIAYDLWLRARGLAVAAYALALPVLLLYAWWGAAGIAPPGGGALLLLAASIGAGLYLANALVDVDLDAVDEPTGLAVRLGQRGTVIALASILTVTQVLAWSLWGGTERPATPALGMLAGTVLAASGVVLSAGRTRATRSMGWTIQAVAAALLGVGLVATLAGVSAALPTD
jgi:4-hydroxybenzoate polyprenyltransferase